MKKEKEVKMKYPCCPICGTSDYDVGVADRKGWTEAFCVVGCGTWFKFKGQKIKVIGSTCPVTF